MNKYSNWDLIQQDFCLSVGNEQMKLLVYAWHYTWTAHCTTHKTLHPAYETQNTKNCTQQTEHCTQHTAYWILHTPHWTMYTVHYTLHTAHCTLNAAHCTLRTTHFIITKAHYKMHNLRHWRMQACAGSKKCVQICTQNMSYGLSMPKWSETYFYHD